MENKSEIQYVKNTRCQDIYTDSSTEYILPDYNGDVRRILYTSATVRPSGSFVGEGEVEYSGIVVYEVVYLDGENGLTSVSFTSDYEFDVKCPSDRLTESYADTRVANFAVRLLGPRKISAKASLVSTPHACTSHVYEVSGSAFSEHLSPQTLTRVANLRNTSLTDTVEREYAEPLVRLDGAIADEVSVIHSSADPVIESVSVEDDEINLHGTFAVDLMIKNGDEAAYREERRIPFDISLPVSDGHVDELVSPSVSVPSLMTSVNADESGSEIVVNLIAEARAICDRNEPVEFIADAYLTGTDTDNVYTDLQYTELVAHKNQTENLNFDFPRDTEELSALREVVLIDATPKLTELVREDNGVVAVGDMRITGVISTAADDGEVSYAPLKLDAPFRMLIPVAAGPVAGENAEVHLTAHTPRGALSSDRITVTIPLTADMTLTADRSLRVLSSSEINGTDVVRRSSSTVTVYYPSAGDTLFEIAKRYRTTPERLATANSITAEVASFGSPDSLASVKRLVIY